MDSATTTAPDQPPETHKCPEALLSLAAGSVLSVLKCPPPSPTFFAGCPLFSTADNKSPDKASASSTLVSIEQEPGLVLFLRNVCVKAAVTELALVISLIYVDRLKKVLTGMARGDPDTPFKIILSALLVVKKFMEEDCVGLNQLFSKITNGLYTLKDINTMERSFLGLLKFSLFVTEEDVTNFIHAHQEELKGLDILQSSSAKFPAFA
ncbi:hypothetical protein BGW38_000680 [Lunasporangiospora selenospora]|uniref:Cyclin N-terminal domain-containing protein n=1 Tax=Lunasporangiospora selenospora TaxID=979761 RepID=A0A9P6KEM3_9FUNG|nr:hypothetical protein BGW38_000680 [Lunasporangiospora selenospora]